MKNTTFLNCKTKKSFRILMTSGLLILLMVQASAQGTNTDFSGKWVLNESKSKFGDSQFRMGATQIQIKQDGNTITDERTMPGFDGGEMKTTDKLTLDGKVCENTGMMDSKKKSTVTWSADKKSITISSSTLFNMNGDGMEMKSSEIWTLGDGGKSLTIESTTSIPDGDIKNTLFYDKN